MDLVKEPKYVRIGQRLIDEVGSERSLDNVVHTAASKNLDEHLVFSVDMPSAVWGTGVYLINESGELVCVKSNWDTSG